MIYHKGLNDNSSGSIIAIVAALCAVFFIIAALVIDGIVTATTQRQLTITSEQAATAFLENLMRSTVVAPTTTNYNSLVVDAKTVAEKAARESDLLGSSSDYSSETYGLNSQGSLGTIEPGVWSPEKATIHNCGASGPPCFRTLVDLNSDGGDFRANAVRVTTRSPGPLRYFFAELFGAEEVEVEGQAIAWVPPSNMMFLVDLSPAIHQDTHLFRNPYNPGACTPPGCLKIDPGIKSEFAFASSTSSLLDDTNQTLFSPAMNVPLSGCADDLPSQISTVSDFAQASSALAGAPIGDCGIVRALGEGLLNFGLQLLFGPQTDFPQFEFYDWGPEMCNMNKCDYMALENNPLAVRDNPIKHYQDDYQFVSINDSAIDAIGDFNGYYIDLSTNTDGNLRGAEPLFSILDGIHRIAEIFNRRRIGDKIALVGFDWETFNVAPGNTLATPPSTPLRTIPFGTDNQSVLNSYQEVLDATNINVSNSDPTNIDFIQRMFFSRGVRPFTILSSALLPALDGARQNFIWPITDFFDVTNMFTPLQVAFNELRNNHENYTNSSVVLFTDGRVNCTSDGSACVNIYDGWRQASNELLDNSTGIVGQFSEAEMPIHIVLYGKQTAPHSLNITDSDANLQFPNDKCLSDKVARASDLPYVSEVCDRDSNNRVVTHVQETWGPTFSNWVNGIANWPDRPGENELQCNQRQYALGSLAGVNEFFYGGNDVFYQIAKATKGLWAPLREVSPDADDPSQLAIDQVAPYAYRDIFTDTLVSRECLSIYSNGNPKSEALIEAQAQRQMFDPWGRTTRVQVREAMETLLNQVNVMLVEALD